MNLRLIIENIKISLGSIKSHIVRTILTVMIIAFGIMALVGILTAISAVEYFLNENFAMMGANTFSIRSRSLRVHIGAKRPNFKRYEPITYRQAMKFKEKYNFPAITSISVNGTGIATLKY